MTSRSNDFESNDIQEDQAEPTDSVPPNGYSFPYGFPLVIYPLLLLGMFKGQHHGWGWLFHGVFLASVGLFLFQAVSRNAYAKIHTQYPHLNRLTWFMNWFLFFVLLPAVVWVVFGWPLL